MTTVVITGASSGIGLDLAKTYAKQGANVMLLARNQERLDRAAADCKKVAQSNQQHIVTFSVDITEQGQLTDCVANINTEFGGADLLIMSAGIINSIRFVDQSQQDFEKIFNTNVFGSRVVAQAFLPGMIAKKAGQVCFISSLGGVISTYGYSAYSASKFAVIGMASAMRQELAEHNIGVSVVCPPEVDTPMKASEAEYILPQTRFAKDLGGTLQVASVSNAVLKGLANNSFIIVPGFRAKMSYWFARVFPRSFAAIMQLAVRYSSR